MTSPCDKHGDSEVRDVIIIMESHVVGDASLSIMAVNPGETPTPHSIDGPRSVRLRRETPQLTLQAPSTAFNCPTMYFSASATRGHVIRTFGASGRSGRDIPHTPPSGNAQYTSMHHAYRVGCLLLISHNIPLFEHCPASWRVTFARDQLYLLTLPERMMAKDPEARKTFARA